MSVHVTLGLGSGGLVAIKTASEAGSIGRLRLEAARLRRAGHPGLVEIVSCGSAGEVVELRTRYAGDALVQWSGTVARAAGLAAAVAATLADLHDIGIVHGRLDASHVLVGADGRPRLCGLSHPDEADPADDVRALGALVDELAARADAGRRSSLGRPRSSSSERRALAQVVARALDPVPSRRPSARALARSILAAVPGAELPPPSAPPSISGGAGGLGPWLRPAGAWAPAAVQRLVAGTASIDNTDPFPDQPAATTRGPRPGARSGPGTATGHNTGTGTGRDDGADTTLPARSAGITSGPHGRAAEAGTTNRHHTDTGPDDPTNTGQDHPAGTRSDDPTNTGQDHPTGTRSDDVTGTGQDRPTGTRHDQPTNTGQDHPAGTAGPLQGADANGEAGTGVRGADDDVPPPRPEPAWPDVGRLDACAWLGGGEPDGASVTAPVRPVTGRSRLPRLGDTQLSGTATGRASSPRGPTGHRDRRRRAGRGAAVCVGCACMVGLTLVAGGAAVSRGGTSDGDTGSAPAPAPSPSSSAGSAPRAACPSVALPAVDVDGDGCPETVRVDGRIVEAGEARWTLGEPGDLATVGDWDCDGTASPAVLRPATGDVFVFARWAGEDEPVTVDALDSVGGGATAVRARRAAGGCDDLVVEAPTGDVVVDVEP